MAIATPEINEPDTPGDTWGGTRAGDTGVVPEINEPDTPGDTSAGTTEPAHAHPTDWLYVKVAIALALLTALEVFTYFESVHGWSDTALIVMLVAMMLLKFFLVVAFFMHLKFDDPIFWQLFVFGVVLAMTVYMLMLTAFRYW